MDEHYILSDLTDQAVMEGAAFGRWQSGLQQTGAHHEEGRR